MNTDFRLSVGYFEHPKIMKLERRLGEGAVLSHIRLLRFASMNKPDGVLNDMDAEEIADAARYKGDAEVFFATLLSVRLLDQDEENGLVLHDWQDWNPWAAGHTIRSAKAKTAAAARWGQASSNDAVSITDNAPSMTKQCPEHDQAMPLSISISISDSVSDSVSESVSESLPPPIPEDNTPSECGAAEVRPAPKKRFVKPTEQDALEYCASKGHPQVSEAFWTWWESRGWKGISDWQMAARNWIAKEKPHNSYRSPPPMVGGTLANAGHVQQKLPDGYRPKYAENAKGTLV
jgi:hypothetical protein